MNGDRRRVGSNLFIVGTVIFLIGVNARLIENWIDNWNSNIRIVNWGWLLIFTGGLIATYGFMTLLDVYILSVRPPIQPGMSQPSYPLYSFLMDREMRKIIWIFIIAGLVLFVFMPGLLCPSMFYIVLVLVIIFLVLGGGWRPRYPPPYYPPQPPASQPLQTIPPPPQNGKVTLCSNCYSQLELNWKACPFCGQPVQPQGKTDNQ
jgi:hypothetical protein